MAKDKVPFHQQIIIGVELEGYTISTPENTISRKLAFHRKGTAEKGENFRRDWSIGTEYNSRPFSSIREGLFLLKAGLRKYNQGLYRSKSQSRKGRQIFLVGGWKDRFAGAHAHVSIAGEKLKLEKARLLTRHLHAHLPLLIAMSASSPVWGGEITPFASNRVLKGSRTYFKPIRPEDLNLKSVNEITLNRGRRTKPPTLEIRVMDSNIPDFMMASCSIVKACMLGTLRKKKMINKITHYQYLKSRTDAARRGMQARLCWNGEWIPVPRYLDRFFWAYREEIKAMDIPQDVWTVFKYLKRGYNASAILRAAALRAHREHPATWQKRFAKRYVKAIHTLLEGNSIRDFTRALEVRVPVSDRVWLGRKGLKLS